MPYICLGSVRGWCGVKHRTIESAKKCCEKDQKDINRAYPSRFPTAAYSDRYVYDLDDVCKTTDGTPYIPTGFHVAPIDVSEDG